MSRPSPSSVLLLGATGTIGRATAHELVSRGVRVLALVRPKPGRDTDPRALGLPPEVEVRLGDPLDGGSLRSALDPVDAATPRGGGASASMAGEGDAEDPTPPFDAVLSCMASRTGAPKDAWAVEFEAHRNVLRLAEELGATHFVLLSAICVQKPRLEFQRAKLAFEEELRASSLRWSIVRATAFFKSLVGQVARVQAGKPFLMFGDGTLTACTPIGDADLATFLADCLSEPARWDRVLPIGGPGPALTPRDHGRLIFEATGVEPRYRRVPVALLDTIVGVLSALGTVIPPLREKAELARIGRYYATESMLVWDGIAERYDEAATPQFGTATLGDYYRAVVAGEVRDERGDHAVL